MGNSLACGMAVESLGEKSDVLAMAKKKYKKAAPNAQTVRFHDDYDVQPGDSKLSQQYIDAITPDHVRTAIAAAQAKGGKA